MSLIPSPVKLTKSLSALVATVLLATSSVVLAADDPTKVAQTVGGVLRVVQPSNGDPARLQLNKKFIVGDDNLYMNIIGVYHVGSDDVAIVESSCGGNGCPLNDNRFLTISPKGNVAVSESFMAALGPENITQDGAVIRVEFIDQDGRRKYTKRWVFANGKLSKSK